MATQQDFDTVKDHTQALADNGMYVFMGEVDHESIKPAIEWILHENFVTKRKRKELLLMICSEGGDMSAAFALIYAHRQMDLIPDSVPKIGLADESSVVRTVLIEHERMLAKHAAKLGINWESITVKD